jgi:cysteine desulfurase/selenocysteine lyase
LQKSTNPNNSHLLGINHARYRHVRGQILSRDRRSVPGTVRISFGLYNTLEEVDEVVEGPDCIARHSYRSSYIQDQESGAYVPEGWGVSYSDHYT